ncbi:Solute carrier family 23 member 2 [Holothuria leucospilota]|uniref:Solute carrier family 23 member 2 n=1 Tax=Holothuria leucospilota TaxID=206669 RepID=A0A9Q1C1I7_HOLLE|nr:Solute carrier family 23 member 2 [Holothuria leucospilota]
MDHQETGKEDIVNGVVEIHIEDVSANQSDDGESEEFSIEATSDRNKDEDESRTEPPDLVYGIDERPPWPTLFMLSTQLFLAVFSGILAMPLILSPFICLDSDKVALSEVIGTNFFVSGIITFLQSTFGSRLPIVQGPTAAYLLPAIVMTGFRGDCPLPLTANSTTEEHDLISNEWKSRMCEIQGAIALASLTQFVIGFTGICGLLMRFIGPITIASTISLIGISLFPVAVDISSTHWGIAALTSFQIILYSQVVERFGIPCPGGRRLFVFRFFPVLLAMLMSWGFCGILTATNVFPHESDAHGYEARTDIYPDTIEKAPWFRVPYPGQWGMLKVTSAGYLGMLAGALASITESIGDYQACARISDAPTVPSHAINRGIGIEGFGCIIAGLLGSGNGSTSYGESIAIVGLTKTSSRIVVQGTSVLLVLVGMFGKINAVFTTIPYPVIGGVVAVTFGFVATVGLSNLQFVDMNSSRNYTVFGFSLFIGLSIPDYVNSNPDAINTGVVLVDQLLTITLGTSMFIGGITACILDNLLPGTDEERGMKTWQETNEDDGQTPAEEVRDTKSCYDLPFGMNYIKAWKWTRYLPFSPTFQGFNCCRRVYLRLGNSHKSSS